MSSRERQLRLWNDSKSKRTHRAKQQGNSQKGSDCERAQHSNTRAESIVCLLCAQSGRSQTEAFPKHRAIHSCRCLFHHPPRHHLLSPPDELAYPTRRINLQHRSGTTANISLTTLADWIQTQSRLQPASKLLDAIPQCRPQEVLPVMPRCAMPSSARLSHQHLSQTVAQ